METDNTNDLYKECLKNHAACLGSYTTDGCGEFTLDDTSPTLQCAACGCHRNFHRKVTYSSSMSNPAETVMEMAEYSDRRPPLHMVEESGRGGKKRLRTNFTAEQKEKMLGFAVKLGWRLQRKYQGDEVERFCKSIGVSRQVFKVWMHNHKNTLSSSSTSTGNVSSLTTQ